MKTAAAEQADLPVEPRGEATRQRILDAAEHLFSECGVNGVSLRTIIGEAGVNSASVHYHFGSKKGLLEAVFARHAAPMTQERMKLLADCREEPGRPPLLEQIIAAFLVPGMRGQHGGATFARLRALIVSDASDDMRALFSRHFDESTTAFVEALAKAVPDLPLRDVHWRFHFLLGAMVYTLMNPGRIQVITNDACDPSDTDAAIEYLVPLLAQMFRSPAIPGDGVARDPVNQST